MATLVTHVTRGKQYVLIGSGYSAYRVMINAPMVETQRVAVCDENGLILWLPSEEVHVQSIDGVSIADLLKVKNEVDEHAEKCPACGYPVSERVSVCPSCGLTLICGEDEYDL